MVGKPEVIQLDEKRQTIDVTDRLAERCCPEYMSNQPGTSSADLILVK
jgi:hypothetical protein